MSKASFNRSRVLERERDWLPIFINIELIGIGLGYLAPLSLQLGLCLIQGLGAMVGAVTTIPEVLAQALIARLPLYSVFEPHLPTRWEQFRMV